MISQDELQAFLQNANGMITSKQITEAGFHRSVLSMLVQAGKLIQLRRGVYMKADAWEDEMYLLQHRYKKGIFSHETALYLHGLTDRTPARFTMTFPWGYNSASLHGENVIVKKSVKDKYELGVMEVLSPAGNKIRAYEVERTLCDIVHGNNRCDIQIVNEAMKRYANSKDRDIQKLMAYAEQLRVKPKILNYMRVLL